MVMTKHAYKKADKKHNVIRMKTMEQILFLSSFFLIDMRMKIDKDTKYGKIEKEQNQQNKNKNKQDEGQCKFFFLIETQKHKNKRYDLTLEPKLWYQLMWTRKVRTREPTNKMNRESKKANMIRKNNLRPVEY